MNKRKESSMATKASKPAAAKEPAKTAIMATSPEPAKKDKAEALARLALKPSVNAAAVVVRYAEDSLPGQDIWALTASLSEDMTEMFGGDMKRSEGMLYAQAHALQSIFMNLARRAPKQEYLNQWEAYLRMGLKAQNQCRMTLETLATIKNPPVVFARQANINNGGQQQVNNGAQGEPMRGTSHAANFAGSQTELLEASDGQRLDTGTTGATSNVDPHMETVGAIHRPTDR